MTLVLNLELDKIKMYHHTTNEVSMSRHSKVTARVKIQTKTERHTDTQTDRHYENITVKHTWAVITIRYTSI